jgi:hypothetical protein
MINGIKPGTKSNKYFLLVIIMRSIFSTQKTANISQYKPDMDGIRLIRQVRDNPSLNSMKRAAFLKRG